MKKHLMILCCLAPLAVAGILYYIFALKTAALLSIMLLCPILHYFFMKDMHKDDGEDKKSCH